MVTTEYDIGFRIVREECPKPSRQLSYEELLAIFGTPHAVVREVAYLHIPVVDGGTQV